MKYTNYDATHAFVEEWRHAEKYYLLHKENKRPESARRRLEDLNLVQKMFEAFLQDVLARKNKDVPVEVVTTMQMIRAMESLKDMDSRQITVDVFLAAM